MVLSPTAKEFEANLAVFMLRMKQPQPICIVTRRQQADGLGLGFSQFRITLCKLPWTLPFQSSKPQWFARLSTTTMISCNRGHGL